MGKDLLEIRKDLNAQIREAMDEGSIDDFVRLSEMIKQIEPKLFAAELAQIHAAIERNVNRRAELQGEMEILREEKGKRNAVLAEAFDLYQRGFREVRKVEIALEIAQAELDSISVGNRELRQKMDSLKESKMEEVLNNERHYQ